jgi:hypothetical protein
MKTLIKPALLCGCENWALNKGDENKISTFERNFLRSTYGPIKVNGEWRIWLNKELYELCKEPEVISRLQLKELGGWGSCL